MSIRKILKFPDPILKMECKPIESFNAELEKLVKDMFETMYDADGIGLAAPQIGILERVITIDLRENSSPIVLINPEIIESSGSIKSEEGCLSIPGYRETINRQASLKVKAKNIAGDDFEFDATELLARCVQHEIDHLNGILFIDHLSSLKKQFFNRWFKKQGPLE